MNPKIDETVNILNALSPDELVAVLIKLSEEYRVAAVELREAWQDKDAGKVWDIAAEGLERTADAVQKYWHTL